MKVYPETKKYKKHDLCVISIENQFLVSFSLDPALYYATPRHNPPSDFCKNGLISSARLEEKKVMKFQLEKITTGWDIKKNVEGGGFRPPALLGLRPLFLAPLSPIDSLFKLETDGFHSMTPCFFFRSVIQKPVMFKV